MEAWEEAELQILEAKNNAFLDAQKGMLELTKMILRGTFLINGAAAAAVLAAKDPLLYTAMLSFAWGTLASVCATAVTYVVQGMVAVAWHRSLLVNPFSNGPLISTGAYYMRYGDTCQRWGNWFRIVAMLLVIASIACFAFGMGSVYGAIK